MVQLTLPKNSTIRTGKTWPKPEGATNLRKVQIYRWNPDDGQNPSVDTYHVDMDTCGPNEEIIAEESQMLYLLANIGKMDDEDIKRVKQQTFGDNDELFAI